MDALRKEDVYTVDDIYALPDGERAELIDGKIYYMAPPGRIHQKFLVNCIRRFIIILRKAMVKVKYMQHHLQYF